MESRAMSFLDIPRNPYMLLQLLATYVRALERLPYVQS